MARITSEKQINSFIKGVITEANPLTYPENASIDEANFVLKRDGSRERRLGMDYETSHALNNTGLSYSNMENTYTQFFQWDKAGGTTTLGIIRIYNKLWFIDLTKSNPSAHLKNSGTALTLSGIEGSKVDFALVNNTVVIVSAALDKPKLLDYNVTTDTVTSTDITLEVRDLWGVTDGLTVDERPTTISVTHRYNLQNQGWKTDISTECGYDPITCTYDKLGVYPSNADIWSLGKDANASSGTFEQYVPSKMVKNSYDNTPVSKGKYIISAYARGASRTSGSGISGLPTDIETGRVSTVSTHASRIFYSGVESSITGSDSSSPNYSGYLFFSQIIKSKNELGKCHQQADPTSDNISDIIDTDGGTIQINDVGQILKLVSTKASLLVFATNGVWEIYNDAGFTATSFAVNKVTDIGISNVDSIIKASGIIVYWSNGGIYILQPDNVNGRFVSQSLSLTTIQTWYNELPEASKLNCKGFFDEKEHVVRWLYNDDEGYNGLSFKYKYNKELVFDIALKAFYFSAISTNITNGPYVGAYASLPNYVSRDVVEDIVVGVNAVQVNTEAVVATIEAAEPRGVHLKYLVIKPNTTYSFTISEYQSTRFVDWYSDNTAGTNYLSYLVTGQELFGDLMRIKQIPYIMFYFKRTEDGFDSNLALENQSSCLVQARWGWSDSAASGKWGSQFQAYRFRRNYVPSGAADPFDYGESVIVTKNKLRGSGKAISLYIESEAGKDMKLLGWAIKMSGNSDL